MQRVFVFLLLGIWGHQFACVAEMAPAEPVISLVDPFIGVDRGGTAPGAQVPFGLVNVGPDTVLQMTSGYSSRSKLIGFSQTHVSGTGGSSKYGNFRVTPFLEDQLTSGAGNDKSEETASPGYYGVTLQPAGIRCDMTASRRVAFHRYTFPATEQARLLIDASSVVQPGSNKLRASNQRPVSCVISILPPDGIEGSANITGGWNPGAYTLYFSIKFDRPFANPTKWRSGAAGGPETLSNGVAGVVVKFDTTTNPMVQMKVGISFISTNQARENLKELGGWDFLGQRLAAERLWGDVLRRIQVEGGTVMQQKMFYTALYHTHLMPHDLTGENVWWHSDEPHYEDFYTVWDTFRTVNPLLTIIEPDRERDLLRSLIDTYEHTGWLPDARIAGHNGLVQGGCDSDVLIADAMAKGMTGIDYKKAYAAMVKNAEVNSPHPQFEGRMLEDYKTIGYVPLEIPLSASRTVEYAYNDFCDAQIARALGEQDDYHRYLERSRNWEKLWDDRTQSIRPKNRAGAWGEPFTRDEPFRSYLGAFMEGTPWQYSTYVPHDVQGLINRLGGADKFIRWLDAFFDGRNYAPDNEPDLLAPYLYIHAGRPDKTSERVRVLLDSQYHTDRSGLPGDDDSGTISAWYIFGMMGIYPNAGQNFYYLTAPVFPLTTIDLGQGKYLRIEAPAASRRNRFITAATLNGHPLQRAWIRHDELIGGGILHLELSDQAAHWGQEVPPPSLSPH